MLNRRYVDDDIIIEGRYVDDVFLLSVKNSKVRHYTDDTNLLLTEKSLKKINKQVNQDLALICRMAL